MDHEKNMAKDYKKYLVDTTKDKSVTGTLILIALFCLYMYMDIFIYNYPVIITKVRIAIIICFTVYVIAVLSYKRMPNILIIWMYASVIELALFFTLILNYIVYVEMHELLRISMQMYMIIAMVIVLFAGPVRKYIGMILMINALSLFFMIVVHYGFSRKVYFEFFNLIFYSIAIVIFNLVFYKSKFQTYIDQQNFCEKIDELERLIENKESTEEELLVLASYDRLTNFYSRGMGMDLLKQLFNARLNGGSDFTICYVDLDGLKYVNDYYGHEMGDHYIQDFAKIVKERVRFDDICIRLGGDEFLLILKGLSVENMEIKWSQIDDEMKDIPRIMNRPYVLSASHGIVGSDPEKFPSCEKMLEFADKKMYKEKMEKKSKRKNLKSIK